MRESKFLSSLRRKTHKYFVRKYFIFELGKDTYLFLGKYLPRKKVKMPRWSAVIFWKGKSDVHFKKVVNDHKGDGTDLVPKTISWKEKELTLQIGDKKFVFPGKTFLKA